MPSQSASRRARNERIAAMQKQQKAAERRRNLIFGGSVVIVVGALIAGITLAVVHKPHHNNPNAPKTNGEVNLNSSGTALSTGQPLNTSPPSGNPLSWPLPKDPTPYVAAANLTPQQEQTEVHYHAHLDIIDNGKPVTVPQGVGFAGSFLTFVHTHDTSGVIHFESPAKDSFTLGQVFVEWGVRLSKTCVGGLCTDKTHDFKIFLNGKQYTGDPLKLVLTGHDEVALWYGAKGAKLDVPSSYAFPANE